MKIRIDDLLNSNTNPDSGSSQARKQAFCRDEMTAISKDKIDPERMAVLRSLPLEIKEQLTGEEARAFLYNEDLPESLLKKLEGYLVKSDGETAG